MKDLIKNKIYEAEISGYSSEGSGVARIEGRAVFVPRTIVGEIWRIVIVKATASAVYGRALKPVRLSPERRAPECEKSLRCGGCGLWHMSYEEEKRFKLRRLNDALLHIGRQTVQTQEIIGSDRITRYRNKGIYAVRSVGGTIKSGFFAPRSHELVPIERCLIQSELADRVTAAIVDFMSKNGVPAYDEKTGRGLVRHVYVRTAEATPDAVAVIVSAGGFGGRTAALVSQLRKACQELTGIVLNVNRTSGNTVLSGSFHTLWGRECIRDFLGGFEFEISPQAFYQINPPQAEKLYAKAVEYAAPEGCGTVLELYCGAGTISLFLAKRAKKVIGAEIIPEAIENARLNAERNGVDNTEFFCADASEAAARFLREGIRPEAVVVDPPRKGMDAGAIRAVCGMGPDRVVYVSCNPSTLARDIIVFNECGYELKKAVALDMFPRTCHVETVVLLSHKKPDGHINVKVEFGEGEGKVPLDNIAKRAEEYKPKERVTYKMIKEYIEAKYGFKVHTAYIAEVKRDLGLPMYDAPNAVEELKQPRKHPTAEKVEAIRDALKHFEVI